MTRDRRRGLTDVHTHLAPVIDGVPAAGGPPALGRPDLLVEHLDHAGFERALVSVPPPFYRQGQDAAATAEWVQTINDGVLLAVKGRPRLQPLAYLPLDQPAVAVEELDRVRADGRFVGATAAAGGSSAALDSDQLAAFWSAIDDFPTFLHPGHSHDPRLEPHYLANLVGNPSETAVAVAQLVFGDVLTRHPALRLVLAHGGGTVPSLVARWDRGVQTARPDVDTTIQRPTVAVRRLWADQLTLGDPALLHTRAVFGDQRMLLGSDWPFPMGTDDPFSDARCLGLDPELWIENTDAAVSPLGRPSIEVDPH